jgi:hypothetical protein
MTKLKYIAAGTASAVVIASGLWVGVASAAAPTSTTGGTSGIPRSVFKTDRLDAVATVLHTTTANVQAAHKDKTLSQLMSAAGLTKKTFAEKLKAQLTTDLENGGYSQSQVTIALQHRTIVRLRHHHTK